MQAHKLFLDIAKRATEPVFSVADPIIFQDFSSVFRSDLDDPALLNAVKLTFAFAVTGGNIDNECLDYQNQAMSIIRERMSSPETAITLPTLGAILLLAGIEVCGSIYPFQHGPCVAHRPCHVSRLAWVCDGRSSCTWMPSGGYSMSVSPKPSI
jgi:hypothetical protein